MIRKIYFLDLLKLSLSRGWIAHLRIFITAGLFALAVIETFYMLIRAGIDVVHDEWNIWYHRKVVIEAEARKKETIERLEEINKNSGIQVTSEEI